MRVLLFGAPRRMVHVVVMDGTLSSLEEGFETNAGLAYRLLKRNAGPGVTLHYQPGLQFDRGNLLASAWSVLTGSGLDLQIQTGLRRIGEPLSTGR